MADKLPKVIVAGLVEKDGKVLLAKELLENKQECWLVPGGHVEFGESLIEAVKREIKEETNLDVDVVKFVGFNEFIVTKYNYHTVIFFFLLRPLNESVKFPKEILDAKFFSKEGIRDLNLVDSAKWILDRYFS